VALIVIAVHAALVYPLPSPPRKGEGTEPDIYWRPQGGGDRKG
jgi:hypothetical protein